MGIFGFRVVWLAENTLILGVEPSSILTSSTKIKYVNFAQRYSNGQIIAPFKLISGGQHEGCLFPIFTNGDCNAGAGFSLVYLENYSAGGQNSQIYNSNIKWAFDVQSSDGRMRLKITSEGYGWTYFIPWVMWTAGPHWAQYYDMDFESY